MKSLGEWLHNKTFKFGIYTSATSLTCQKRYGSYEHELIDANTYCKWGVNYIKIDNCGGKKYSQLNTSWIKFRQGIVNVIIKLVMI